MTPSMLEYNSYFFLYPLEQTGLIAVTVLVNLPLMQVIVVFFNDVALCDVGDGVGVGVAVEGVVTRNSFSIACTASDFTYCGARTECG